MTQDEPNPVPGRRGCGAFTLIELLVVIAIIAARKNARSKIAFVAGHIAHVRVSYDGNNVAAAYTNPIPGTTISGTQTEARTHGQPCPRIHSHHQSIVLGRGRTGLYWSGHCLLSEWASRSH